MFHIFIVVILATSVMSENGRGQLSINGMHGFLISCKNNAELSLLKSFQYQRGFDFMTITRDFNQTIAVLVEENVAQRFEADLNSNNIEYTIFTRNFREIVDEEATQHKIIRRSLRSDEYNFTHFPTYNEISNYLHSVQNHHPDLVKLFTIGKTYEGRETYGAMISTGGESKAAIVIDAGIHAREWIAPTTALYIIAQLLKKENRHLLENVNFYVIPCVNPDGYEYSHSRPENRLWRKSRTIKYSRNCIGVDLNRNFDFQWTGYANHCSEIYSGKEPFSEPETQNLRNFILFIKNNTKIYMTLHSYGQLFMYPWAFTKRPSVNDKNLREIGARALEALQAVRGTHYRLGSVTDILYYAYGTSLDWVYGKAGVKLSYTMELPGSKFTKQNNNFIINKSEIVPVGRETFELFKVLAKYAAKG